MTNTTVSRLEVGARATLWVRLPLYVYMFYVIYSPPIFGEAVWVKIVIFTVMPVVLILHHSLGRDSSALRILVKRPVASLIVAALVGSFYVALIILQSGIAVTSFDDVRIVQNSMIVLVLMNVVVIVVALARTGHDKREMFGVALWMGAAQGVFALLGLAVPAVRDISRALYQASGGTNSWVLQDRIFGFSSDFTYATQIYHAILAGCALYFMIKEKRRTYLVPIFLIMTTSLLNGRTGLLAFIVMAVIVLAGVYLKRFNVFSLTLGIGVLFLVGSFALSLLETYSPATHRELTRFFDDTEGLILRNERNGNYSVLVPELLRIPEGDGFLFGTGIHLYDQGEGIRTDIGFTNDLFAGGLIYIAILYTAFVVFLWRSFATERALFFGLLAAFVIANLKGEFFRSTTLLFVFVFVALVTFYGGTRKNAPGDVNNQAKGEAMPAPRRAATAR